MSNIIQLKLIKNNSKVQDKNQEEFKTQEESLETRIKIQGSKISRIKIKIQDSRSRFKTQDSRMKRRLNQDKY